MRRRDLLSYGGAFATSVLWSAPARAGYSPSVVIAWNRSLLTAIAATRTQAPIAARAISMVHEAIYNAWAGYDATAAFTLQGLAKQPWAARTLPLKSIACCHAAHTVLWNLFPSQGGTFDALLATGTPTSGNSVADAAAAAAGRAAGNALVAARQNDGGNQLGNLAAGAYADYTGYVSVNTPDQLVEPTRWQPLRVIDTGTGQTVIQSFLTPHWNKVRPFALWSASAYRPLLGQAAPTTGELQEVVALSAGLTAKTKAQVELWAGNPGSVSPPGQWMQIAEVISAYDCNTLGKDVKLFFGAGQALLDASIAAWDAKRYYDSVRPISAVRNYLRGQIVNAWGGPGNGTVAMLADNWMPYQRPTNPTPPFPEFISGHSTFSQAAASVLAGIRASDGITFNLVVKAGSLGWESPPQPLQDITFTFTSLPEAAASAGMSRRLGGIHFERGDLNGRNTGRAVGDLVLARCRALFEGRNV